MSTSTQTLLICAHTVILLNNITCHGCDSHNDVRHVTKVNACILDELWCAGFRTAHTAAFTCSAYRAGHGQKVFCVSCTHVLFSFDAGAGVVLDGEWPEEGSAELDVECD